MWIWDRRRGQGSESGCDSPKGLMRLLLKLGAGLGSAILGLLFWGGAGAAAAGESVVAEAMETVSAAARENVAAEAEEETSAASREAAQEEAKKAEAGRFLVALDPGHGGEDEGCSGGGTEEKEINLSIALLLRQYLEEKGYRVLLTREGDTFLSLEERVRLANENRADIFVSIHQNSCEEGKAQGVETWYAGIYVEPGGEADAGEVSGVESDVESDTDADSGGGTAAGEVSGTESDVESDADADLGSEAAASQAPCVELDLTAALAADRTASSRRLARLIQGQVLSRTDAEDREAQGASDYYVTVHTAMPSCLIETGFLSDEKERQALESHDYQEKIAAGIAEGIDLYFFPKTMYLTFDDGPTRENSAAVLDILKEWGIRATFFVVGENVRKNPEVAKRIVDEGHTIGIHCNSHRYEELYESAEAFEKDFQAAFDAVYEATGTEPVLFRFPGGSINAYNKEVYEEIIRDMTEKGFIYFDWNASLEDAVKHSGPEDLLANARKTALGRKRVVMLAHDTIYDTVLCLPELLDQFPEYRMEPLDEKVTPIQFK